MSNSARDRLESLSYCSRCALIAGKMHTLPAEGGAWPRQARTWSKQWTDWKVCPTAALFLLMSVRRYDAATMANPVKLQDVVDSLDMLGDEMSAYLNKRTGEIVPLTEEEYEAAEEQEEGLDDEAGGLDDADLEEAGDLADYPEWKRESILKAREIIGSNDWVELPTKADIHEWGIMEKFGESIEDPEMRDSLLRAIRGSGAFARFRQALDVLDLREVWFDFRAGELERIAVEWLEENEIEYTKEPGGGKAS